jgi:beta-glucosidase
MSGDGNGFATRYAEDFRLLADLGLRHHRLSIEWARIEPEPGDHDAEAIAHYRDMLAAALDAGIEPWVCLHHFTLPRWFAATGGFLVERNRVDVWARHVDFVAETFGDLVRGWQPINETNYYPAAAYLGWGFPPGHHDRDEHALASEALQLATAEAAVRLKQTGAPVSSIFGLSGIVPLDDAPATTRRVETMTALHWRAGLELFRDGVLRVPNRDPVERSDLAGSFDLLGFSYYSTIGVEDGAMVRYPADAPESPLGYGIWADGLGLVLDRLHEMVPGTPLLVAEYGIGTDDDTQRAAYIERGLQVVHDAIGRGVDVRGLFQWTAVDNYEWLHGYYTRFGLIDRDRNVRPSAEVLRREATL